MACHSYSELSTFEQCPKKFEFRYRIKPDVPRLTTVEAFLGSRVHEALERLYRDVQLSRAPESDELVAWFDAAWDREWTDDVAIVREEYSAADYRRSGREMLRRFFDRQAPFDDGLTIGLELRVSADLDDEGRFGLIGYVDRLVRTADGAYEIHDYKTGRSLLTQERADEDLQLSLYEMAVRRMYADVREVTLVWHYLALDSEVRSVRSSARLEELRESALERMRAVEACADFPARVSALCDWCEYKGLCPAWAHERDLAGAGAGADALDGVALVDRLAVLDEEMRSLESERDQLRERLIAWAGERGYDRVAGTTYTAKIWRTESSCSLPAWDAPERASLDAIVREAGLWDRYSSLAGVKLAKAVESGELPEDVRERIMDYVAIGPRARIYMNRRRG